MEEYKYGEDILSSMMIIDGLGTAITTIRYVNENDSSGKVVTIKIVDNKKMIIYPEISGIRVEDINVLQIELDNIEFFRPTGEIYREHVISGGGSGKINVAGAIVGDLIAGPAGMILGGAPRVNEVKSELVTHDTRKIELSYFLDSTHKTRRSLFFGLDVFQYFSDNIPEKEYTVVDTKKKKNLINDGNSSLNIKDKIKELNEMLKDGLITQEEYDQKKAKLLDDF